MICPSCGTTNSPGSVICASCGAALATQPTSADPAAPLSQTTPQPAIPPQAPAAPPIAPPPPGYAAPAYAAPPSTPPMPPAPGYTGAPSQAVPPAMPQYAPQPAPDYVAPQPAAPVYAPPSTPMYTQPPTPGYPGYAPPSTPMYAPPSTPMYAPPSGFQPGAPVAPPPGGASPNGFLANVIGPTSHPASVQPTNWVQRTLRSVAPAMSVNPWFTAAVGAVSAMIVGLILTAIAENMWHDTLTGLLGGSTNSALSSLGSLGSGLTQPPLLLLFAIVQRAPLSLTGSATAAGATVSLTASLFLPLTGLFALPAIALIFGGFVSASSDYTKVAQHSVARGALMGPFYAVLLGVLGLFTTSTYSGSVSQGLLGSAGASVTFGTSFLWEALFGLLWGLIFGALGGWLAFSGWSFMEWAIPLLQRTRQKLVGAALAGGIVSYVTGALLAFALLAGLAGALSAYNGASSSAGGLSAFSALSGSSSSTQGAHGIELVLIELFTLAPVAALWLFTLASGSSLNIDSNASYAGSGSNAATSSTSISLFSGTTTTASGLTGTGAGPTTHTAFPSAYLLLLLLPLIAWLAGGIAAARTARARTGGEGFTAGAVSAIPFAIIFAAFAALTGLSFNLSLSAGTLGSETVTADAGASFFNVLIVTLIGAAVVSGVGGALAVTTPWLGSLPLALGAPLQWLFPLLDSVTGQRAGQPRSATRRWLYTAAVLTVVAIVVLIVLDIANSAILLAFPYNTAVGLIAFLTALVIFLPLAYLTGALVTAFTAPLSLPTGAAVAPVGFTGGPEGYGAPVAPSQYNQFNQFNQGFAPPSTPMAVYTPPAAPTPTTPPTFTPAPTPAPPALPISTPPPGYTAPQTPGFAPPPPGYTQPTDPSAQ